MGSKKRGNLYNFNLKYCVNLVIARNNEMKFLTVGHNLNFFTVIRSNVRFLRPVTLLLHHVNQSSYLVSHCETENPETVQEEHC